MKASPVKKWSASACQPFLVVLAASFNLVLGAEPLQLVSVLSPARGPANSGGGDSLAPIMSPDGRYVLFASTANNLASPATNTLGAVVNPPALNVFLRDRSNGTTVLVSVDATGMGVGNANSLPVGISTNGRFALFESSASNLVPGDTNGTSDVFVRDILSNTTLLVSAGTNGGVGNACSQGSAMSADGRYVAFLSGASNLVPGDSNNIPDAFVRDLSSGVTTLVSAGARANGPLGGLIGIPTDSAPGITPDGGFVVFHSAATGLVAGVTTTNDIYVRDMASGTMLQVSAGARTATQSVFGTANAACFNYILSADGRFVAYEASPLTGSAGVVLRYDAQTGLTDLIHTNAAVTATVDARSLDMTPDGRFVAFVANTNGVAGTNSCVLAWDAQTGTSTLASSDPSGKVPASSTCDWPTLTPDGRYVVFMSSATGLVTNSLPGQYHLYERDLQAGTTTLVDSDTNNIGSLLSDMPVPCLSADGRFVAFEAPDGNLVPLDRNRAYDVFVRDLVAGATELVSVRDAALPCLAADGPSQISLFSVSADGRYAAFSSDADDLVDNDTNGFRDVFIRDLVAGTNLLVSVAPDGVTPGDNFSFGPSLSSDGRYVAFTSSADNLVPGDTNKAEDVFVRDMQAGTTVLVSVNTNGTGPGNADSYSPTISATGRYVLFTSAANNLAAGPFRGANLFWRDMQAGVTYGLTTNGFNGAAMSSDGRFVAVLDGNTTSVLYVWDTQSGSRVYTNKATGVSTVAISPDGQRVIYWTSAGLYAGDVAAGTNWLLAPVSPNANPGLRFSADSRFLVYAALPGPSPVPYVNYVYLYDFQNGTNMLISQNTATLTHGCDSPDISADGRYVAYRSAAADVVPTDDNNFPDVFLFDRLAGTTTLVSRSRFGSYTANSLSRPPVFSAGGQLLLFGSWASDLVPGDFNLNSDVVAYSLPASGAALPFSVVLANTKQGYWLTWPVVPGKAYHVQYKDTLSDPVWHTIPGGATIIDNTGYLKDPTPNPVQRFYRVVTF